MCFSLGLRVCEGETGIKTHCDPVFNSVINKYGQGLDANTYFYRCDTATVS